MKKYLTLILAISFICVLLSGCGSSNSLGKFKIGICQFSPHEALDLTTEGFKKAVTEELGEENVEFDYQNAQGDSAICATIVNKFVSDKVDLILANSTPSLQTAVSATADIPILGTSVTEYGYALQLEEFDGKVGGNVSGTSDFAPLDSQADMIKEWFPAAKTVGLLYCSAEANSEYQVNTIKTELEKLQISSALYPFADSNELANVCSAAAEKCDVIYVPTDNTVASNAGIINNICEAAKIPVIGGDKSICAACSVASLSINYDELGYTTGKMAVKILKGEADISQMPIEYAPVVKYYNEELCKELNITPAEGYSAVK